MAFIERVRMLAVVTAIAVIALLAVPGTGWSQHRQHGEGQAGGGHGHRFDDPAEWSKRFDDPARDEWQKPDEVIRALALEPAHIVADIGAGTGYFTVRLARAVPSSLVFAVDVEPKMARHIAERARTERLANVRTVVGSAASANLPQPVDRVLLVNSYHHIDERTAYFRDLRESLRPGARVAIIDYRPDAPRGSPKHMRMAPEKIAAEMKEAGYRLVEAFDFLPLQTYQIFEAASP